MGWPENSCRQAFPVDAAKASSGAGLQAACWKAAPALGLQARGEKNFAALRPAISDGASLDGSERLSTQPRIPLLARLFR